MFYLIDWIILAVFFLISFFRICNGGINGRMDRDVVCSTVQNIPGISFGVAGVNHGDNFVTARKPDQTVGRLAVRGSEGTLAVDDGVTVERLRHARLPVRTTT